MFWFKKVAKQNRVWKELLRENLGTIPVDMFYGDDPVLKLGGEDRKLYLKKFNDLMKDKDVMGRIAYLVNKQANLTLKHMKDGNTEKEDMASAMNINGIALVKEDFERLGTMFDKEEGAPPEDFDRFGIV